MSDASFEAPSLEEWRALVDKALKGAPFESLTTTTLEGIPIAPLYGEQDRPAAEGIPWAPRAKRAVGPMRSSLHGVDLASELRGGASAVHLWLDGLATLAIPAGMLVLVEGAFENTCPLASESVRVVQDPWARMRAPLPNETRTRATGDDAIALVADALARGGAGLGASAAFWSDWKRADAVESLALAAASLVESLRRLDARGVDLERAVSGATVTVDVGTDFFLEIARIRALRRVLDRLLRACGVTSRPIVHARTSERSRASLDAPTNLIRFGLGAAAALIGGADSVCVRPHAWSQDAATIPYDTARNVPLVLALESHLAATEDPARGAPYVETLTAELGRRAWSWLQEIESSGGIERSYSAIFDRLSRSSEKRESAVRRRQHPLVGVSRFPDPRSRGVGGPLSLSFPFEVLRDRAAVAARVVVIGACPEARVDFAREVAQLASQRVEVVKDVARGDASFVILAAPDAELGSSAVEAARTLSSAGAKVGVAGKPGAHERALRDAGVSSFVFVGADVVDALEALLPGRAP